MKTRLCFLILIISILAAAPCPAQEHARQFLAAMEAYKAEDYPGAVKRLEAIASSGIQNGELYYDIGNAHLKNNDLGRAILWYERALTLLPNDPDLRFNYEYARSLTKDAQDENGTPLVRILFFWKYELSAGTVIVLALGFNLLFWGLATTWRLTRRRGVRYAALATLVPAAVLILTAAFNYYESAHPNRAIILPDKIAVRSGLEPSSTELFELHAGARVRIVRTMKGHVQIRFSEDKIGWIENEAVGRI
jgi:tetratricopeptide (TPR) repeat protein